MLKALVTASLIVLLTTSLWAQDDARPPNPTEQRDGQQDEQRDPRPPLKWPDRADQSIATVHGDALTLGDLVRHIDEHHSPDFAFAVFMEGQGRHYLDSPLLAGWIRAFADINALRRFAETSGRDLSQVPPFVEAAKKRAFEDHLSRLARSRSKRGMDFDPSRGEVRSRLAKFERERGLQSEVQGLLDFLVPPAKPTVDEARDYYRDNARAFGGAVEIAHILIHHRDPRTGLLLDAAGQQRAVARVAEVRASLEPGGGNFGELARRFSDDRATAERGGHLGNVQRFDPVLPPELARIAWSIQDGDIAGPVETRFGMHFIRREALHLKGMVLFTEALVPRIAERMRIHQQEDLLLQVRGMLDVELLY